MECVYYLDWFLWNKWVPFDLCVSKTGQIREVPVSSDVKTMSLTWLFARNTCNVQISLRAILHGKNIAGENKNTQGHGLNMFTYMSTTKKKDFNKYKRDRKYTTLCLHTWVCKKESYTKRVQSEWEIV